MKNSRDSYEEIVQENYQQSDSNRDDFWEAILDGHDPASHFHGYEYGVDSSGFLKMLADKIKSVEGIDESANAIGQVMPTNLAPVAASVILAVAIPFVWLGVLGMKNEYEEAKSQFEQIIFRQINAKNKIQDLQNFAQKYRSVLQEKFGLNLEEEVDLQGSVYSLLHRKDLQKISEIDQLAYQACEYQTLENKKLIAQLGKKFGWTGVVGMSGMFAGMFPSLAISSLEVVQQIQATAAIESAIIALKLASNSLFIAGEVAMIGYAANRWKQGILANEDLKKAEVAFDKNSAVLKQTTQKNIKEIFAKQRRFIQKHSVEYGKATVAGQSLMIGGSSISMTGLGFLAGVPLLGIGLPVTIGAAFSRIFYQDKEQKFKGKNSQYVAENIARLSPIYLFAKHCDKNGKQAQKAILKELDAEFEVVTNKLAAVKSLSLLHRLVNDRKYQNKYPRQKLNELQVLLKRAAEQNNLKGSDLEGSIIQKVRSFFLEHRDYLLDEILRVENKDLANHKLALLSAKVLLGKDEIGYKDGELLEKLDLNLVAIMFDPDKKTCARDVIQKSKEALKALRFKIADSIVCVTQVAAAHKVLSDSQREIELKQIVKNPTQFATLKEIKLNLDVPDKKSFFATSASRLVEIVTTLYRPQIISFDSYWYSSRASQNVEERQRGNDFKTVNGIYDKGEKQIESVLLNIIILVTSRCNKFVGEGLKVPMNLQDALNVIEKAQMQGGVYHKKSDASQQNLRLGK